MKNCEEEKCEWMNELNMLNGNMLYDLYWLCGGNKRKLCEIFVLIVLRKEIYDDDFFWKGSKKNFKMKIEN